MYKYDPEYWASRYWPGKTSREWDLGRRPGSFILCLASESLLQPGKTKTKTKTKANTKTKTKTFWEHLLRAIQETCDLWDICSEWWEDMTWPKKLTKTNTKTTTMTKTKTKTFWEHLLRAILETCDIWDTDYNSDNWEPEFMTIFVTWQLIVTLDSIRNSCDIFWIRGSQKGGGRHLGKIPK